MAVITPGTGGTFKSTTLEAAVLEAAQYLQNLELASTADPQPNNVSVTYDTGTNLANITVEMPITVSLNASGQKEVLAVDYIDDPSFAAGTGGTIKGASPAEALFEMLNRLNALEIAASASAPDTAPNNLTVSDDNDNSVSNISVTLPIGFTVATDGSVKIAAVPYI